MNVLGSRPRLTASCLLGALLIALACLVGPPAAAEAPVFHELALRPPARVRITAGRFALGSDDGAIERAVKACLLAPPAADSCNPELFADERPARDVYLAAYSIDRLEVSNAAYGRCVHAGVCLPSGLSDSDLRLGRPEHPVAAISWQDAQRYCSWAGGALPSEAQWERAARGNSARTFPWGREWNGRLANHGAADGSEDELDGFSFAAPVDAFPDGRSFYGLQNMAGNVGELVADHYAAYPTTPKASAVDPSGPRTGSERVIRGGSWRSPPFALRVTARARIPEQERRPDLGFRCAYAPPRAPSPPKPDAAAE
jgi:formylglycine-generating enzyme required for sulfatase activity